MNLQVYAFHKSGSMFLYKLFFYISRRNNINFYSINNGTEAGYKSDLSDNKILCPLRYEPRDGYNKSIKYIVHYRNPIDTLISQYYSYGYTHGVPSIPDKKIKFMNRRIKIQSQTIDEYCLSDENVNTINEKYIKLFNWINKYKDKKNVYISNYDLMYYNYKIWIKEIHEFLNLDNYIEVYNIFKNEFSNSTRKHKVTNITHNRKHHRSGLSRQYLTELKKETVSLLLDKLSDTFKHYFF